MEDFRNPRVSLRDERFRRFALSPSLKKTPLFSTVMSDIDGTCAYVLDPDDSDTKMIKNYVSYQTLSGYKANSI
jgi:hypothetical protein